MQNNCLVKLLILAFIAVCTLPVSANAQSLFDETKYQSLTSDKRSLDVGQSLTVLIYEQASAASTADTDTNRSNNVSAGYNVNADRESGGIGFSNRFEGGGTVSRTGRLMASITVTIVDITKQGELLVDGGQIIELNNETQHIHLQGRVRKEDVSTENTVISNRVADAKIVYKGDGLLGKRQTPGILTRAFNLLF